MNAPERPSRKERQQLWLSSNDFNYLQWSSTAYYSRSYDNGLGLSCNTVALSDIMRQLDHSSSSPQACSPAWKRPLSYCSDSSTMSVILSDQKLPLNVRVNTPQLVGHSCPLLADQTNPLLGLLMIAVYSSGIELNPQSCIMHCVVTPHQSGRAHSILRWEYLWVIGQDHWIYLGHHFNPHNLRHWHAGVKQRSEHWASSRELYTSQQMLRSLSLC